MTEPAIHLGTCSWKFPGWRGLVYSDAAKPNYLQEYARHFDCVEIDQWFYSLFADEVVLPQPKVVAEYAASVPENFRFAVKLPNALTLTHFREKDKPDLLLPNPHFLSPELLQAFLDSIQPLKPNLGPLMFQFGYLNQNMMPSQAAFQEKLEGLVRRLPGGYTWCMETRNPDYLNADYFRFLRERGLVHVWQQGYFMPPVFDLYAKFADQLTDETIVRFHGPDPEAMEARAGKDWSRIIEPRDAELDALAGMLKNMVLRKRKGWVFVNNHYEGCAPRTLEKIKVRMGLAVPKPADPFSCRPIQHGSPEYAAAVALRDDVLRKPLGLLFSDEQLHNESRDHHLACFLEGRLVGCLVLTPESEGAMRMRQVAVAPDCRNRGIGRALVLFAELYATRLGCRELTAHARETALGFYMKLGYSRVGNRYMEVGLPHIGIRKAL